MTVLKNLEGAVTYSEIFSSTDLKYIVSGNEIKENIILKDNSAPAQFVFNYDIKKLGYRTTDENQIELYDENDTENVVFIIDAPYMYDANRAYSNDVELILEESNKGLKITLVPDSDWLSDEERVWPVVIDPPVLSSQNALNIWDITLQSTSGTPLDYTSDRIMVGSNQEGEIFRTLMKFNDLPKLSVGEIVVSAHLNLSAYYVYKDGYIQSVDRPTDDIKVNIHRVRADWPQTSAIWVDYGGNYDPLIENYFIYNDENDSFNADITRLVSGWYSGTLNNYGLLLKAENESPADHFMQFASSDWGVWSDSASVTWRPCLSIIYRNCVGIEDYWSYSTQDNGRYGVGYVNNFNGNLIYIHNDVSYISGINGFTLSHVYNSANTVNGYGRYGGGWSLNLIQRFEPVSFVNDSYTKFVYTDGDGTKHYFVQLTDGSIVDEDGLGYTYMPISEGDLVYQITDKVGNKLKFDYIGYLRHIIDTNGNYIQLNYSPIPNVDNYLTSITTSSGGSIGLFYNDDYVLTHIVDTAGRRTTVSYDTVGNLASINYPDGDRVTFDYYVGNSIQFSHNWLQGAVASDSKQIRYGHYGETGKIYCAWFQGKNSTEGNCQYFNYKQNETRVTDTPGRYVDYQFDVFGRTTCVYDSNGNTYSESYTASTNAGDANDRNTIFSNNKLSVSSGNVQYINNRILNPGFIGPGNWTTINGAGSIGIIQDQSISSSVLKIENGVPAISVMSQVPLETSVRTYTFSGYFKTQNIASSTGHGAGLEVVTSSPSGNNYYYSDFLTGTTDTEVNNGYTRLKYTFTISENETIIRATVGLYNASGTVWIDNVQLEEGDSANNVNLVNNPDMEFNSGNGTLPTGYLESHTDCLSGVTNSEAAYNSYSLKFDGVYNENRHYYQDIYIAGKKGDSFSFGAWTKGYSIPATDDLDPYKMVCEFTYTDGTTGSETISFNTAVTDWQYGMKNIIAQKDYNKATLYLCYNNNCNSVLFDSVFLYRDTAQSYTYDSNGNVISVSDKANQQSTYNYNNSALSRIFDPMGTGYEYAYDTQKNNTVTRSSEGIITHITYDASGNPLTTVTEAGTNTAALQDGKTYRIRLKNTGKYLAVYASGTANGTNIIQESYTGADNQKWTLEKTDDGYFVLHPYYAPNISLDVTGGANNNNNNNIATFTNNLSDAQKLTITPQSDYTYKMAVKCFENETLVSVNYSATQNNVSAIVKTGIENNPEQEWYFEDVSADISQIEDGAIYQFRSRYNGKYIDVTQISTAVGAAVNLYEQWYGENQKFIARKYGGTEYYTLTPVYAEDRLLEVSTNYNSSGYQYLQLGDSTVTDRKLFRFDYMQNDFAFNISPKCNESIRLSVLDTENGAMLVFQGESPANNYQIMAEKLSQSITSSATYQNNGNFISSITDSRGNVTNYSYNTATGTQTSVTDANGNTTSYNYDGNNDRLTQVTSDRSVVKYSYNGSGELTKINTSARAYIFTYDNMGNVSSIASSPAPFVNYTYDAIRGNMLSTTYGNGNIVEYSYDLFDRITTKWYNGIARVNYTYDKSGNLYKKQDWFTGVTTDYDYDLIGRLTTVKATNGTLLNYTYDNYNRISKTVSKVAGYSNITRYIYGDNSVAGQQTGIIYGINHNGNNILNYGYDSLCRLTTKTVNTITPFVTQYNYLQGKDASTTTTLVKSVKNGNDVIEYTYDNVGNITTITVNGTLYESYTYDSLNQLKTVTRGSDTWEYSYSPSGDIGSVKLNGTQIKTYSYMNDNLSYFNGSTITYDAIGNPLNYRDGMTMSWSNGRQLTGITSSSNNISFLYNADGLRSTKTVNGVTTEYYWLEDVLLGQKTGNDYIIYLYDESGNAYGLICNNTYYYYIFNAQGDVIGILDANGTQVVAYDYSAWGEVLSVSGTMANTIGQQNPIRYRGYYYDTETGFYLTGTRYYDPEIGRFINADNQISGVGSDIRGYNLFAYCFNNPVNMSDPTGNWPRWITATVAAVAAVVAVVATVVSAPVVATVAATVAVVSTVAYVAQSHHYDKRKAKNTNLPKTPQEADDLNWKNSNPKSDINPNGGGPAADCHQYTSPDKSNVKFVSPDGHREVIYNSTGNMVLDSRDIGTYNYSPSGTFFGSIGHFFADMLPWYLFGNDDDDPGPLANEIIRLFE